MAKSKIKVKVVEITNNLLPSKPKLYKPALQTPTVVSSEKFIENIAKETGLSRFQAANVLSCIFQTAGDYMELGNAVQLHEDFGTLKPYIKVKAVADRDKVTADCILGMGLRLIPTGKMRTILGGAQYTITGMSTGGDVEDSEVVDPSDPNDQQQGNQQQTPTTVTLLFQFQDGTEQRVTGEPGAAVNVPANTVNYVWDSIVPSTFPDEDVSFTEVADTRPTHTVTYRDADMEEFDVQTVHEGAPIIPPTPPTGYHWIDVPSVMPDHDINIRCAADS